MKNQAKTDALTSGDLDKIDGLLEKWVAASTSSSRGISALTEKEKVEKLIEWTHEAGDKIGVKPKI